MHTDKVKNKQICIASFNCKNIYSSRKEINELLECNDIVMLQETWLMEFQLSMLNNLHSDFYAKGVTAVNIDNDILTGRPYGGLAILWKKDIAQMCKIVEYNDNRLMGLELNTGNNTVMLINVYLPYNSTNNSDEYLYYLSKIEHIVSTYNSPYCYVVGDFNADVTKDENHAIQHKFGSELYNFCITENLIIADDELCPINTFTFLSEAHGSTSWLDHVITTVNGLNIISDIVVNYNFVSSDHLPLQISILLDKFVTTKEDLCDNVNIRKRSKINWEEINTGEKIEYKKASEHYLKLIKIDNDILCDKNCTEHFHLNLIDKLYNDIVNALWCASIKNVKNVNGKVCKTPGWNEYCSEAHSQAREAFLLWCKTGKPRNGEIWFMMKKTRAYFKYALRYTKSNQDRIIADNLANKLLCKNSKDFWKEIKKYNNNKSEIATTVNNVTGIHNITNMWQNHYKELLNSCSIDNNSRNNILQNVKDCDMANEKILYTDVASAVKKLKCGKSSGLDNLNSEHFIYASERLYVLLAILFNACLIHGYLPQSIMNSVILPIVKDSKGDVTDKNNYRPIAITTVSSKVLELIIIDKYADFLQTSDNQFGFKKKHSTDQCIFILKEVIEYYNNANSPVYVCFLDASKAFDRLNHWVLFKILLKRQMPSCIVRLLIFWYTNQTFMVQWGNLLSSSFYVTNGVRQGGVLSPLLFNLYMNDLSVRLNNSTTGCYINNTCVNHLFYADDSILFAPTVESLQKLLCICDNYAKEYSILFNVKKTKCMYFVPKWLKDLNKPCVKLGHYYLDIVQEHNYLGYIITNYKYTDDVAIKMQTRKIYAKGNMLYKSFLNCTPEVKTQLFKSYVGNIYCSGIWTMYKQSTIKSIQIAYKKTYRKLMCVKKGQTTTSMINNNVTTFDAIIRKSMNSLMTRINSSDNSIVKCIVQSVHYYYYSDVVDSWICALY